MFGAGVVGVTAAWYLAADGHEVTVVDRQPGPALETSFANGGQISASHAAPWANPRAPRTILKWLGRADAPLLFRPRMDWAQWRWAIQFLIECLPSRTLHNTIQCVNLALYSRDCLRALRATTGIEYDQLDARDTRVPYRREGLRRRGESGRADARIWRRPRSQDGRRVRGDRARARCLPRAPRRRDLHRVRRIGRRAAVHAGARPARRRARRRLSLGHERRIAGDRRHRGPRCALPDRARPRASRPGVDSHRRLRRRARQRQPVSVDADRRPGADLSGQGLFGDDRSRRPSRRADRFADRSRSKARLQPLRRPAAHRGHRRDLAATGRSSIASVAKR